jgi:hypothetical protein
MRKYAAPTALAIALNITMLTPAFSAGAGPGHWMPRYEVDCGSSAKGFPQYAIFCHCTFECRRQIGSYTETVRCWPWERRYWDQLGRNEGLCDVQRMNGEAFRACWKTCVKAKDPSILPRP